VVLLTWRNTPRPRNQSQREKLRWWWDNTRSKEAVHRMHEMRTIAVDDSGVCQCNTQAGCAKTAEWIDVLFVSETPGDPRNVVSDGVHIATVWGRRFDAAFTNLLWRLAMCLTDTSLLRTTSRIVQQSLSNDGYHNFQSRWVFVATWYKVNNYARRNEVSLQHHRILKFR